MSVVVGAEIDISSRFSYSLSVTSGILEEILKGETMNFSPAILPEIDKLFDTALRAILPEHEDLHEENKHYLFLGKAIKDFSDRKYDDELMGKKILEFSGLVKNLKIHGYGIVNVDRESYAELQNFLSYLGEKTAEQNFERTMNRDEYD
ncbi:hypothetical protein HYT25_04290 [Candidatus Pacearchaeota archaeon]|nr:hypothetical protein [Candidatus Pacearchaeota archaeon]